MSKPILKLTAAERRTLMAARLLLQELGAGKRVAGGSREEAALIPAALDGASALRRVLETADLPA